MKVAIVYCDSDGQIVLPSVAAKNPIQYEERIHELPMKLGVFMPVLTRHFKVDGLVCLGAIWVYFPPDMEQTQVDKSEIAEALEPFGPLILEKALLLDKAPDWIKLGLLYARAAYKPLFDLPPVECEGFVAMARSHPLAFESFARVKKLPSIEKKRMLLAVLLSKWALLEQMGTPRSLSEKISEFERATGEPATTWNQMEAIRKRIERGEAALNDGQP